MDFFFILYGIFFEELGFYIMDVFYEMYFFSLLISEL
jgi:hypothetical protein